MWLFLALGFALLEEKLCGAKCCKYFRPEGVLTIKFYEQEHPVYSYYNTNY